MIFIQTAINQPANLIFTKGSIRKYFAKALAHALVSSALVAAASGAHTTSGSTSNVNVDHITQTGKASSSGKNTQKMEIGNAQ